MATDLILGTAGHIDHGKTALVAALTGTNTDRLPEEKRRGITIELGFAHLELGDFKLGIVDVPGHERFVRQMLAGATGMDLAMLVVAADDSVKPQTREHVEVLRMLNLSSGVVVLTKCDLADPDWMDLVEAEIAELVEGCFLESAPIVRTSAITGEGIDELKTVLAEAATKAAEALDESLVDAPFRMAIDRTFTMTGHGTVVTGSVVSGTASLGDELEIQPGSHAVRIRGIQNHDSSVESVHRGQRAAINLAGVHHDDVERGHELAAKSHLDPSRLVTAEVTMLPAAPRPLKHRSRVRVHVGTAEVLATVSLLDAALLEPGQSGLVQLYLREPIAAVWRQPLVLRAESPVVTIGGGHILVPAAEKIKRLSEFESEQFKALSTDDLQRRAAAALYFNDLRVWSPTDLLRLAGISNGAEVAEQLGSAGELVSIKVSPTRTAQVTQPVIEKWAERITAVLERLHEKFPLRSTVERSQLLLRFENVGDNSLFEALIRQLAADGVLRLDDSGVGLSSHKPKLSPKQQEMMAEIVGRYRAAELQPPSPSDCYDLHPKQPKEIDKLIRLAVSDGQLMHIAQEIFLHPDVERKMRTTLKEALQGEEGMTLSAIRELLNTTRKYAVPLCEYLDKSGFTKRKGDLRFLSDNA